MGKAILYLKRFLAGSAIASTAVAIAVKVDSLLSLNQHQQVDPPIQDQVPSRESQIAALKSTSSKNGAASTTTPTNKMGFLDQRARSPSAEAPSKTAEPFDILVIGGGITGSYIALDAALRGLKVALIEPNDFGTASSSSCLKSLSTFCGIRQLEKVFFHREWRQIVSAVQALREERIIIHQAPFISHVSEMMLPCYKYYEIPLFWTGMKLYDAMTWMSHVFRGFSSLESIPSMVARFPAINTEKLESTRKASTLQLKAGISFSQFGFDDCRYATLLVLTASLYGAHVCNHISVESFVKEESADDIRVQGVIAKDRLSGQMFEIRSKSVINASEKSVDTIRKLDDPNCKRRTKILRSTLLSLPEYCSPNGTDGSAMTVPRTSRSNDEPQFLTTKWNQITVAGVVHHAQADPSQDALLKADIGNVEAILENARKYLSVDIYKRDVLAAWVSETPLVLDENDYEQMDEEQRDQAETANNASVKPTVTAASATEATGEPPANDHPEASKEVDSGSKPKTSAKKKKKAARIPFTMEVSKHGLISVIGSHWFDCRQMASSAVDLAVKNEQLKPQTSESRVSLVKLVGASNYDPHYYVFLHQHYHRSSMTSKTGSAATPSAATKSSSISIFSPSFGTSNQANHLRLQYHPVGPLDLLTCQYLQRTYGQESWKIAKLASEGYGSYLVPHHDTFAPWTEAEVIYCIRNEMCVSPTDFLGRSSRIVFSYPKAMFSASSSDSSPPSSNPLQHLVRIFAQELRWDAARIEAELQSATNYVRNHFVE